MSTLTMHNLMMYIPKNMEEIPQIYLRILDEIAEKLYSVPTHMIIQRVNGAFSQYGATVFFNALHIDDIIEELKEFDEDTLIKLAVGWIAYFVRQKDMGDAVDLLTSILAIYTLSKMWHNKIQKIDFSPVIEKSHQLIQRTYEDNLYPLPVKKELAKIV